MYLCIYVYTIYSIQYTVYTFTATAAPLISPITFVESSATMYYVCSYIFICVYMYICYVCSSVGMSLCGYVCMYITMYASMYVRGYMAVCSEM